MLEETWDKEKMIMVMVESFMGISLDPNKNYVIQLLKMVLSKNISRSKESKDNNRN